MGSSTSTQACEYCAYHSPSNTSPEACLRCGGITSVPPSSVSEEQSSSVISSIYSYSSSIYQSMNDSEKCDEFSPYPTVPLKRLHILPFLESLGVSADAVTETFVFERYLQPYFSRHQNVRAKPGDWLQIQGSDFKVVSCYPPGGVVCSETVFHCNSPPLSAGNILQRVHILPCKGSAIDLPESKELLDTHVIPYFAEPRHLLQGETFLINGVQFRVMACEPLSGMTDSITQVFVDGSAIVDLEKLHLLPIYNSLPNQEKNINEADLFQRYLKPYFLGTDRYVTNGENLMIDGVEFKVVAALPFAGLVTSLTSIYANGAPLQADDLRQQQLSADEELARRLQQEDGGLLGLPQPSIRASGEMGQLQQQMYSMMSQLPPNHRHRLLFQRLADQLGRLDHQLPAQDARGGNVGLENFLRFVAAMSGGGGLQRQPSVQPANESDISTLPTRKFTRPASSAVDPDKLKCMICLTEYEVGEELRTLPCFHQYQIIYKMAVSRTVCPWTGNVKQSGGPGCPFMSKEDGMDFSVLVLGSNAPRPHVVSIQGYPPNLSVLDFLELAEAGKTFGDIQLMSGLNWNMMVLRKWGEPLPLQMNEPLTIEKGGQIVLEPKDFSLLGIDLPNRKRPCNMPNLTKQWRVQELKLSLVLLHQLPISERRCLDISLYRKSDQTFSDPIPNHLTLYQLDLNPDDRLVYNLKPLSFEPSAEDPLVLKQQQTRRDWTNYTLIALVLILVISVVFVTYSALARKAAQAGQK